MPPTAELEEWEAGTGPDDELHEQIVASPILLARVSTANELALEWRDDVGGETFSLLLGGSWSEITAPQAMVSLPEGRLDVLRVRNAAERIGSAYTEAAEQLIEVVEGQPRATWQSPLPSADRRPSGARRSCCMPDLPCCCSRCSW